MSRLLLLFRRILARLLNRPLNVSSDYRLNPENLDKLRGWKDAEVAERQHNAFAPLIRLAMTGNPRLDFRVAADAVAATHEVNPMILEIGCGSGYYSQVLPHLLGRQIRYAGVDYSEAMTALGKRTYADADFVTGDALALPVATDSCDIALSGTSLMHIPNYRTAIGEMARVSRRWCIFHTVPVMANSGTVVLSKLAYGERVPEVIFNRGELESLFSACGLSIRSVRESFPYDLSSVVGEKTTMLTYLCEKVA